jgi:hypothetical protein
MPDHILNTVHYFITYCRLSAAFVFANQEITKSKYLSYQA